VSKLKFLLLAAPVIAFFSLTGCNKTTNNITQGTDSVYTSGWFAPTFTISVDQYGDSTYEQLVNNAAITSAVVNDGVVLSYLGVVGNINGSNAQDTVAELATDYGVYTTIEVGSLLIQSLPIDEGGLGDFTQDGTFFRYVVIPGSVLATTKLTPQELKSMSFTEVTRVINSTRQTGPAIIQ